LKKLQKIGITIIILVVAIFLLQRLKLLPDFASWFRSKPLLIENTPLLVENIRDMAQMVTQVSFDEVVIKDDDVPEGGYFRNLVRNRSLADPLEKRIALIARGRVFAGLELNKVKEEDLYVEKDSVRLFIPPAQVLDAIVNPSDCEIFIEEGNWSIEEVNELKKDAREMMRKRSVDRGLLTRAQNKAISAIENFFRSVGFKKVVVLVK
jgi:hypothetical protein